MYVETEVNVQMDSKYVKDQKKGLRVIKVNHTSLFSSKSTGTGYLCKHTEQNEPERSLYMFASRGRNDQNLL